LLRAPGNGEKLLLEFLGGCEKVTNVACYIFKKQNQNKALIKKRGAAGTE
jgi:hypothetical protein